MKKILILIICFVLFPAIVCNAAISDTRKILYLVPDAIFRNYEGKVVEWLDPRPQPTQSEIDAVPDQMVFDSEEDSKKERKFNTAIIKAMGLTIKDYLNEIMAGRVSPITNSELKAKFKSYLD